MATESIDQGMIEHAYAIHAEPLRRRLTATTGDRTVAEDLAQEAFARLVAEVSMGRTPDNVGAWLHRVGHNLAMSRGRRIAAGDRRRHQLVTTTMPSTPEALVLEAERHDLLRSAIARLSPTDRRALILAAHGYRAPEIAREMGRTDGATRTLLCRARTKVRGLLVAAGAF
jgi:RNA polymerase sigma-70 factor (ECF subfamily)